jgi:hypothetical protein
VIKGNGNFQLLGGVWIVGNRRWDREIRCRLKYFPYLDFGLGIRGVFGNRI